MKGWAIFNRGLISEADALIADLEQEVAMTTYRDRHLALESEAKKQAKAQKQAATKTSKTKSK